MIRSTYALVLLVCGGLVLSACGKKKDDADSTAASASAAASAAPSATASAAPADTASAAPSGSASAVPADTTAPPVGNNQVAQRPIDDCCIGLATIAVSRRRNPRTKNDAFRAAEICPGIAALVRQGRATRAQALAQIRSAMAGERSPPACQ